MRPPDGNAEYMYTLPRPGARPERVSGGINDKRLQTPTCAMCACVGPGRERAVFTAMRGADFLARHISNKMLSSHPQTTVTDAMAAPGSRRFRNNPLTNEAA